MNDEIKKKLNDALYGISVQEDWADSKEMIHYSDGISPPSYMLKLVLKYLYGNNLPSGRDKSEWEISLKFNDSEWIIWDWKKYRWNILGFKNKESDENILRGKLIRAANILNQYFKKESKSRFKDDDFALQNNFYRSLALFEFFKSKVNSMLLKEAKAKTKRISPVNSVIKNLNKHIEIFRNLEHFTIATVVFFFAHTECIWDSCFSISDRKGLSYQQFNSLDWTDKFKFFFKIGSNDDIENLYIDLIRIRKYYRNIPVHSSPEFFYQIQDLGMIPSDYENILMPHMSSPIQFKKVEAENIIKSCKTFLELIKSHKNTMYGYLYAKSGLLIFIDKESTVNLKQYMTSLEEFEKELLSRCELQDAFDNMII